jgi:hypothetical protein
MPGRRLRTALRARKPRPTGRRRAREALRALFSAWVRQREAAARLNLVDSLQSQVPDDRTDDPRRGA